MLPPVCSETLNLTQPCNFCTGNRGSWSMRRLHSQTALDCLRDGFADFAHVGLDKLLVAIRLRGH